MSEQFANRSLELEPPIPTEAADAYMREQSAQLYDDGVYYDRGRGPERFKLLDDVHMRMNPSDEPNGEIFPAMVLQAEDGQKLTIDTRDYLGQTGFDSVAYYAQKASDVEAARLGRERQRQVDQEQREQAWQAELESNKPYYADLFRPILRPEPGAEDDYNREKRVRTFSRTTYEGFVTDVNRQDSAELLTETLQHDQGLLAIISSFEGKVNLDNPLTVVDAIRENAELRFAIGIYYVNKIHHVVEAKMGAFKQQVRENKSKRIELMNPSSYVTIPSRDNVALICLAKLDGSFAGRHAITKEKIDSSTLNTHHRPAADYVIAS